MIITKTVIVVLELIDRTLFKLFSFTFVDQTLFMSCNIVIYKKGKKKKKNKERNLIIWNKRTLEKLFSHIN